METDRDHSVDRRIQYNAVPFSMLLSGGSIVHSGQKGRMGFLFPSRHSRGGIARGRDEQRGL